jgi:hypothetical protein
MAVMVVVVSVVVMAVMMVAVVVMVMVPVVSVTMIGPRRGRESKAHHEGDRQCKYDPFHSLGPLLNREVDCRGTVICP